MLRKNYLHFGEDPDVRGCFGKIMGRFRARFMYRPIWAMAQEPPVVGHLVFKRALKVGVRN